MNVLGEDEEMMDIALDEYTENESEYNDLIEEGTVFSVNKTFPCQLTIKNNQGETLNFLWTEQIDIENQYVTNPDSLKGKQVRIVYYNSEFYDAQSGVYMTRKVLIELTLQ